MRSIARGMMCSKDIVPLFFFFGSPLMDSDLPCDADSLVRWSFPTSCSSGSASLSDDFEGLPFGKKFPSTGTIPILLFDDDEGDDDVGDLELEPDSASISPPFGILIPNGTIGHRVARDRSSAILKPRIVGSPAAPASPESSREGTEESRFNLYHPTDRPARLDAVDGRPPASSGSADDGKEEEEQLSVTCSHAGSPPQSPLLCCCRPCASRSGSSLGATSEPSAVLVVRSGTQSEGVWQQRTCYDSCCASPAAITHAPLIAAAKPKQNFALEDLLICQASLNSFALYDCVEPLRLPLNTNHDQQQQQQQQCTCATSSSTSSSAEADSSVDFRTMDHSFPLPHSPSIGPSPSSSSSSNSNLPLHLSLLQDVTISLCIDQESFRTVCPAFKLVGYTKPTLPIYSSRVRMQKPFAGGSDGNSCGSPLGRQQHHSDLMDQASVDPDSTGMAEFMPLKRESFVFHHSTLDPPPSVRRLSVNGDESRDYLSQYAYLTIKSTGGFQVYVVRGSETRRGSGGDGETVPTPGRSARARGSSTPIKLEWRFEYAVEDKRKADGTKAGDGEKFLTPLRFSCSPELLHPRQGRKVTVLSVWKKSIQSRVLASKLEPLAIASPTRNLSGPLSSPTSPRSAGVAGLRLPSASRLWRKQAKNSPYPFDKGSDGSEEELIPSEGAAKRRKRRPTSAYVPRMSLEAEWPPSPPQMWDRDRGQSADAVWQANRDVRPATAGAEGSMGRSRAQSFGRGVASEGENDRSVSSRSRGGPSTARHNRRPRTAR